MLHAEAFYFIVKASGRVCLGWETEDFLFVRTDGVAQLVEHGTHKPGVVGSIPTSVTRSE